MAFSLDRLTRCFSAHFAEEVVYRPAKGSPRRIKAVVDRNLSPESIIIEIDNSAETGIVATEINHQRDIIDVPLTEGGFVSTRYIALPFPSQDAGRLKLDLRRMLKMTVTRPTDTTTAGTTARTYAAHLTNVPCRWTRKTAPETERYAAKRVTRSWIGSINTIYDVQRGDKCVFVDDIGTRTVYVIDVADIEGESRHLEAEETT